MGKFSVFQILVLRSLWHIMRMLLVIMREGHLSPDGYTRAIDHIDQAIKADEDQKHWCHPDDPGAR